MSNKNHRLEFNGLSIEAATHDLHVEGSLTIQKDKQSLRTLENIQTAISLFTNKISANIADPKTSFSPFANDDEAINFADFNVENHTDSISLYGSFFATDEKPQCAKTFLSVLQLITNSLSNTELPETAAEIESSGSTQTIDHVPNPFD